MADGNRAGLGTRFRVIAAVHLFLLRGDEVLLLRRYNTGYEDGNYSTIAGHLDGGEEVVQAAAREAREEAGVAVPLDAIEVVGVMHRVTDAERIDFFATARSWSGEIINTEPEKCDALDWFGMDHLPGNMIGYVRAALDNYRCGRWFESFGWPRPHLSRTSAPDDGRRA